MTAIALIVSAVAALYALDQLGLWMERRGWLYYRKKRATTRLGHAVLEVQAALDPNERHLLEVMRRDDADEQNAGCPPRL
jgi:hypothetical protein